jgi:hypothetical protein
VNLLYITDGQLRELDARVGAALSSIAARLHQRTIQVTPDVVAWGQYLDERHTGAQWGLLGTSAASQALVLTADDGHPYAVRDDGVSQPTSVGRARAVLPPDRHDLDPVLMRRQIDGRELFNIVRLASIAEALHLDRETITRDDWPPLVEEILRARGGNPWWSSESAAEHPPTPQTPNVFVTAFVVYALRRYEDTDELLRSRIWLAEKVADPQIRRRLDLTALIGLALLGIRTPTDTRVLDGVDHCRRRVLERRAANRAPTVDRPVFVGYSVENRTDYAFLNPEHLCALFLLEADNPVAGRRFVLRTIDATIGRIESNHGFDTELGGEATVEQLWVVRLLRAYLDRANSASLRSTVRPSWFLTRRALALLMFAVLAVLTAVGFFFTEDHLGGAIAIAAAGILALLGLFFAGSD